MWSIGESVPGIAKRQPKVQGKFVQKNVGISYRRRSRAVFKHTAPFPPVSCGISSWEEGKVGLGEGGLVRSTDRWDTILLTSWDQSVFNSGSDADEVINQESGDIFLRKQMSIKQSQTEQVSHTHQRHLSSIQQISRNPPNSWNKLTERGWL